MQGSSGRFAAGGLERTHGSRIPERNPDLKTDGRQAYGSFFTWRNADGFSGTSLKMTRHGSGMAHFNGGGDKEAPFHSAGVRITMML
jgi:hypothetical protein